MISDTNKEKMNHTMEIIQYRKSGSRLYYKVNETTGCVLRVRNKESYSQIDVSWNRLIMDDAKDTDATVGCPKDEFVEAYHLAMERIQTLKV